MARKGLVPLWLIFALFSSMALLISVVISPGAVPLVEDLCEVSGDGGAAAAVAVVSSTEGEPAGAKEVAEAVGDANDGVFSCR